MANIQGKEFGNIKELRCPRCRCLLVKTEGTCDNEYTCISPECRIGLKFPKYYGSSQEDIDGNLIGLKERSDLEG